MGPVPFELLRGDAGRTRLGLRSVSFPPRQWPWWPGQLWVTCWSTVRDWPSQLLWSRSMWAGVLRAVPGRTYCPCEAGHSPRPLPFQPCPCLGGNVSCHSLFYAIFDLDDASFLRLEPPFYPWGMICFPSASRWTGKKNEQNSSVLAWRIS